MASSGDMTMSAAGPTAGFEKHIDSSDMEMFANVFWDILIAVKKNDSYILNFATNFAQLCMENDCSDIAAKCCELHEVYASRTSQSEGISLQIRLPAVLKRDMKYYDDNTHRVNTDGIDRNIFKHVVWVTPN